MRWQESMQQFLRVLEQMDSLDVDVPVERSISMIKLTNCHCILLRFGFVDSMDLEGLTLSLSTMSIAPLIQGMR